MPVTITDAQGTLGAGVKAPLMFGASRVAKVKVYTVAFDTSYPTGGEDITAVFNDFTEVLGIWVQNHDLTIADNRVYIPDLTNKKLIVLDAFNVEEGSGTDLAAITNVRLLVVGF